MPKVCGLLNCHPGQNWRTKADKTDLPGRPCADGAAERGGRVEPGLWLLPLPEPSSCINTANTLSPEASGCHRGRGEEHVGL